VQIIPVLVDGAKMPSASDLPPSLKELARRQAVTLSPVNLDTRRLVSTLETVLEYASEQGRQPRKLAVGIVMNWRRFLGVELTGVVQTGHVIALLGAAGLAPPSLARPCARSRCLLVRAGPGRLAGVRSSVRGDLLR
jgi:hypothetical protein